VSVYSNRSGPSRVQQLGRTRASEAGVASVQVISAADALEEFRQYSGFGTALARLAAIPANAACAQSAQASGRRTSRRSSTTVGLAGSGRGPGRLRVGAAVQRHPGPAAPGAQASPPSCWGPGARRRRQHHRLEIQGRRTEIEVVRLVGGSTGFVRRPFLYTGTLYGLGRVAGLGNGRDCRAGAAGAGGDSAQLYGSRYTLNGPGPQAIGLVLAAGVVLGWLGAWVAAAGTCGASNTA